MKENHLCLGEDESRGIPCDSCREREFWERHAQQDALQQEREAS